MENGHDPRRFAADILERLGILERCVLKLNSLGDPESRTVYRNASGLPNDEQVTTARDQATPSTSIRTKSRTAKDGPR